MGVFAALAYVVTLLIRIPLFGFLTLDPKDTVIGIAGFILGPLAAIGITLIVASLEIMISGTGLIGFLMNAAASITFVVIATLLYRRNPSFKGAIVGLLVGAITMTAVMLFLNYLLTPIYMGIPRADVAAMLVPALLPFNIMKSLLNAVLILLLYRPVMRALDAVGFSLEE